MVRPGWRGEEGVPGPRSSLCPYKQHFRRQFRFKCLFVRDLQEREVVEHEVCGLSGLMDVGAQVAEWLARRPLPNVAWVRFPAGDLIPAS